MRNSILYVVGAVVLLGGGAFLFLKNKNKKDLLKLKDSALENLGGSTPPTTPPTTPSTPPPASSESSYNNDKKEISPASLSNLQAVVYAYKYQDLRDKIGGNLQALKDHWNRAGKEEKRTIPVITNSVKFPMELTDEQALIYLSKYPDLLSKYGINIQAGKDHWNRAGKSENRTIDIIL